MAKVVRGFTAVVKAHFQASRKNESLKNGCTVFVYSQLPVFLYSIPSPFYTTIEKPEEMRVPTINPMKEQLVTAKCTATSWLLSSASNTHRFLF